MIKKTISLLPVVAVVFAFPSFAQQQSAAASHDDLLRGVEQIRDAENKAFQDRKAEYESKANQAEKDALLRTAEQQRQQLDAASDRLSETYQANELRIGELNTQLRDKAVALGLGELFGLARQSANDTSSILQQSLITTQFPAPPGELPRDEWLRQFSSAVIATAEKSPSGVPD